MTKGIFFLLVLAALQPWVQGLQTIVGTCEELEAGIHTASVTSIFVDGRIATLDCMWRDEEAPSRFLEITGTSDSTLVLGGPGERRLIWKSGPGSIVNFLNLEIVERSSSLMSLDLDIFREFDLSSIFLSHSTLALVQCASDVHMRVRLEKVVNNERKNGIASICLISDHEIHAESLIYHTKLGNSIHMTNTSVRCGSLEEFRGGNRFVSSIKKCEESSNPMQDILPKALLAFALGVLLLLVIAFRVVRKKAENSQSVSTSKLSCSSKKDEMDLNVRNQPARQAASSLELGLLIGRGNFCNVFSGIYDGSQVAIKILEHKSNLAMEGTDPLEAVIAKKMAHPNVVRTIVHKKYNWDYFCACGCFDTDPNNLRSIMSSADDFFSLEFNQKIEDPSLVRSLLVMEYCRGGSLHSIICKDVLTNKKYMHTVLQASIDVARAMEHIHSSGVIHGDLKTQNVLLSESGDSQRSFVCKVGDFGMSRFTGASQLQHWECGSVKAMPPEVLTHGLLSQPADVYSYGILLWELLEGSEAYFGWSHQDIVHNVVAGRRPEINCRWPCFFVQLIEDCWQQSHQNRPSFERILELLLNIDTTTLEICSAPSSAIKLDDNGNEHVGMSGQLDNV